MGRKSGPAARQPGPDRPWPRIRLGGDLIDRQAAYLVEDQRAALLGGHLAQGVGRLTIEDERAVLPSAAWSAMCRQVPSGVCVLTGDALRIMIIRAISVGPVSRIPRIDVCIKRGGVATMRNFTNYDVVIYGRST